MGIGSVVLLLILLALTVWGVWLHIKKPKHEYLFKPADVVVKEALGFCLENSYHNELLANSLRNPNFSLNDFKEFMTCPNKSKSFPDKETLITRYLLSPDEQEDLLLIARGSYTEGIQYNSIVLYHGVPDKESFDADLHIVSYMRGQSYPNMFVFDSNSKLISWA